MSKWKDKTRDGYEFVILETMEDGTMFGRVLGWIPNKWDADGRDFEGIAGCDLIPAVPPVVVSDAVLNAFHRGYTNKIINGQYCYISGGLEEAIAVYLAEQEDK
jgi:hypothetical protein